MQHKNSDLGIDDIQQWYRRSIVRIIPSRELVYVNEILFDRKLIKERPDDVINDSGGRYTFCILTKQPASKYIDCDSIEPYMPVDFALNCRKHAMFIQRLPQRQWCRSFNHKLYAITDPLQLESNISSLPSSWNIEENIDFLRAVNDIRYYGLEEALSLINNKERYSVALCPRYVVAQPIFSEAKIVIYNSKIIGTIREEDNTILLADTVYFLAEDLSQFANVEVYDYV